MREFLVYLIESSACMGVLYLCFGLFMKKEACFRLNRATLLLVVLVSLSVPFLPVAQGVSWRSAPHIAKVEDAAGFSGAAAGFQAGEAESPVVSGDVKLQAVPGTGDPSGFFWWEWLACIYGVGVLFVAARMAWRFAGTFRLIRELDSEPYGKCRLIVLPDDVAACSLGRYIVISRHDYEHNRREILTHEQAHRHFGHLFDLVFLTLAQTFFWFNPFIYLVRRDMREVHEFQADRYTLDRGVGARDYQMLVIRKCVGEKPFALATGFHNDCPVKKRIRMMNLRPKRRTGWKALAYLPVLFVLAILFGRPVEATAGQFAVSSGTAARDASVRFGRLPESWFVAGTASQKYIVGIDSSETKDGKPAVSLCRDTLGSNGEFGTLMQTCLPGRYLGKRVRMTGYLKSDRVFGGAGLWLRVDGKPAKDGIPRTLSFDNMGNRTVSGTSPWTKYEIVLDVPQDAAGLAYGVVLQGGGQVWAADLSFEEVDRSVPVTGYEARVKL